MGKHSYPVKYLNQIVGYAHMHDPENPISSSFDLEILPDKRFLIEGIINKSIFISSRSSGKIDETNKVFVDKSDIEFNIAHG